MNRRLVKVVSLVLVISLLVVSSLVGCGTKETEETTVYVGLLLPFTGPAASGYQNGIAMYNVAIDYVNNETAIPGVKVEILTYDDKLDAGLAVQGYEWLKEQGVKLIMTDTVAAQTLASTVAEDKFPLTCVAGTKVLIDNPGYVFCVPPTYYQAVQGFLKWLETAWPSYPTKPKIGVFGWQMTWGIDFSNGAQDYCAAHSDNFTWVGSYLAPYPQTTAWSAGVEQLKDCDYIICGAFGGGAATFITEYRNKEYDGKFVGHDPWGAFWETYVDSCGKTALDETLIMSNYGYYLADSYAIDDVLKRIVVTYGTQQQRDLLAGSSWSVNPTFMVAYSQMELLREAVKSVEDPADITGELLYNITITQQLNIEGFPTLGYSATNRVLLPFTRVYEYSSIADNFHMVGDWVRIPGF